MNDFDKVKQSVNILEIITRETGLQMKGQHLEECPFCHGHNCFSINEAEGYYKCFQCDAGGDVFTFLEKYHSIDSHASLEMAAKLSGVKLQIQKSTTGDSSLRLSTKERIFAEAAQYYHSHIFTNGGSNYLVERRGHCEDVLKKMQVGWSDGNLTDFLKAKGFAEKDLVKSHLSKEWTNDQGNTFLVDFFRKGTAIFPHYSGQRVAHFTFKDPADELEYQLPNEARAKEWRFYNQNALQSFSEVIVVEGENDLLSVMDAGVHHVIGLIGQPAEYQIKSLKSFAASKHLYLWLDNDAGGEKFIRKICGALRGISHVRIITHPGDTKDPDEYLLGYSGNKKAEIKRLKEESLDYLSWEICEISKLESLEKQLNALKERGIFSAVAEMVEAQKLVFISKIEALGFTRSAVEEQLEFHHELLADINGYYACLSNKKDADPNILALKIFTYFNKNGRFFYDRMNDVFLLYQHFTYEIGNNRPFNALIKRMTGMLPTKEPGRSVWESLASEAYNSGRRIDIASWIFTDRNTDTIYVNLNSPENILIKLSKHGLDEIPNGLNPEGVFLKSSRKIMPFQFLPDTSIFEGMKLLKSIIFDNLTCDLEQRYLVVLWTISALLLDFAPYMALMKFSGSTASGKTTAARLLSLLIYGNEHLGDPTGAAAYAIASQNPLLIIDNLESEDLTKTLNKFLLLSATKGQKEKRTGGTESDTTQEDPKALVLVTAIEPFTKAELINRTYDIDFSSSNKSDDFFEDEVIRQLIKKRDIILTAILKFVQIDVLPSLEKRKDYITVLKKEYKGHAKCRTDEYLSTLMLMLEKILKYIPYYDPDTDIMSGIESGDKDIRKAWIEYQNAKAKETETSSNSIIKLLDSMVREYLAKMKDVSPEYNSGYEEEIFVYTHPEYLLELIKTKPQIIIEENGESYTQSTIEFIATATDIVQALDRFCKNNGLANPFKSVAVFISRLMNDTNIMKKSGWEIITKPGMEPHYKKIRGVKFWKLRKTIVR